MIAAIFAYSSFKQATQAPKPKDPEIRTLKVNKLKLDAIICIHLSLQFTSDLVYLGNYCLHSLTEKSRFIAWGCHRGGGLGWCVKFHWDRSFPVERNVIILLKLRRVSSGLPHDLPGIERTELLFRGVGHEQFALKSMGVITALRERVHDTCWITEADEKKKKNWKKA